MNITNITALFTLRLVQIERFPSKSKQMPEQMFNMSSKKVRIVGINQTLVAGMSVSVANRWAMVLRILAAAADHATNKPIFIPAMVAFSPQNKVGENSPTRFRRFLTEGNASGMTEGNAFGMTAGKAFFAI